MAAMGGGVLDRLRDRRRDRHHAPFDGWDPVLRPRRPPLVRRPPVGRVHELGQGAVPAHESRGRPRRAMDRRHRPRGRRPFPPPGRVPRDVRDLRLARGPCAVRAVAAPLGAGADRYRELRVPIAGHRVGGHHAGRDGVRPRSAWDDPAVGGGGHPPVHRVRGHLGPLPRRRFPGPEPLRVDPGGRRGPARVPLAGPRGRVPRDVP